MTVTSTRIWRASLCARHYAYLPWGMKAVKQLHPKKGDRTLNEETTQIIPVLITDSDILSGNTMMNNQSKWPKFLCNEPCVNCPSVHSNTKSTNEAHSLIIFRLTFVRPLLELIHPREIAEQNTLVEGPVFHLEVNVLQWDLTHSRP